MAPSTLTIVQGDLTKYTADCIVNAANRELAKGGGLDGAIRSAAGEEVNIETAELRAKHGPLREGACVITGSYRITTTRAIIHSAAPDLRIQGNMSDAMSENNLYACYYNAFRTAERYKMSSIALPILGSGIYKYPMEESLLIAIQAVTSFVFYAKPQSLKSFIVVVLSSHEHQRAVALLSGQQVIDLSSPISAWGVIERHVFPSGARRGTRKQIVPGTQEQVDFTTFYDNMTSRDTTSVRNVIAPVSAPCLDPKNKEFTPVKRSIGVVQVDQNPTPSKRHSESQTQMSPLPPESSTNHRSLSPSSASQGKGNRSNLSPDELAAVRQRDRERYAANRAKKKESDGNNRRENLSQEQLGEVRRKDRERKAVYRERPQDRDMSTTPSQGRNDILSPVPELHLQPQPILSNISNQSSIPLSSSRSLAPLLMPVSTQLTEFERRRALLRQYDTATVVPSAQVHSASIRGSVPARPIMGPQIALVQNTRRVPSQVAPVYRNLPTPHNLGAFDQLCEFCNARSFIGHKKCCNAGKVWIDPPRELPPPIKQLIDEGDKDFLKNIVSYNTLLAMASLSYTKAPVGKMGVQASKVLGAVTHWPSALFANDQEKQAFGNYYVYDSKTATTVRNENDIAAGLNPQLLEQLHDCMIENHPLALCYKTMYRMLKKEIDEGREPSRLKMRIVDRFEANKTGIDLQQHPGTYSVPSGKDFICVFFSCNTNQIVLPRGLTVYSMTNGHSPREIRSYIRMVDSLCYPLIFPYGGGVWEAGRIPIDRDPQPYETRMDEIAGRALQPDVPEPEDHSDRDDNHHIGLPNDDGTDNDDGNDQNRLVNSDNLDVDVEQGDNDEEFHMLNGNRPSDSRMRYVREERGGEIYIRRGEMEPIPREDGYLTDNSGDYDFEFDDDIVDDISNEQQPDRIYNEDEVFDRLDDLQLLSQNPAPVVANNDENMSDGDDIVIRQPLNVPDGDLMIDDPPRVRQPRGFVSMRDAALFLNRYPLGRPSQIAQFRRLGQLHIIDVLTRVIHQRMEHIQTHFTQTMTTTKNKMLNCLQNNLTRNGHNIKVGSVTTVPSHIAGSPRYLRTKFENAVALANLYGRPDLFITFTANIKWSEILEQLPTGRHGKDTFADHPHIVAEVFNKKLDAFLADVVGKIDKHNTTRRTPGIFGEVLWFVYSIEFQQRGPPHVHLVISLREHIETTQRIDEIVSARIPPLPAMTDPEYPKILKLRELVIGHMIHTACENEPSAYCQKDKKPHWKLCNKRFPKTFSTETSFGDQSYPDYYRPDDGEQCTKFFKRRPVICKNSYVVPYNPFLLYKYQSHINCEVISTVKVVRYLFKYVFKGFDRNLLEAFESFGDGSTSSIVAGGKITQSGHILHSKKLEPHEIAQRNHDARARLREQGVAPLDENRNPVLVYDETSFIEDLRAVTSCEAAYEIRGYERFVSSHEVTTLHVHEEHEETVQYVPGEEQNAVDRIEENGVESCMKGWFALNQLQGKAGDVARTLTYDQIPKKFIYKHKKWVLRAQNRHRAVGRVKPVQPRFLELFAIRLLCINRTGITSFESLRTVDGVVHDTYVAAAKVLRLMNDEEEWDMALREAATYSDPITMRRLFISILVFCHPKNARALWESHKESLFENKPTWTLQQKTAHALYHIQSGLKAHELSLTQFGLPEVVLTDVPPRSDLSDDLQGAQHTSTENTDIGQRMYQQLNPGQKTAVDAIIASSTQPADSNRIFFLEGAGGTGKTFIYTCLSHLFEGSGLNVLSVAHTGIAATLLRNGSTAHRAFSIPIEIDDTLTSRLNFESYQSGLLADIDVIIWDEATMTDRRIYEAVDNLLRIVKNQPTCFMGGILTVFGGDWRQTLPIVENVPQAALPRYTLKATEMWKSINVLRLSINQRALNDPGYSDFLLKIGQGLNDDVPNETIRIPSEICLRTEEDVIQWLYHDDFRGNANHRTSKSLLTIDNRTSLELNEKILCMMPGNLRTYLATDTSDSNTGFLAMNSEAYKTMTPSGMPPHELNIKIGSHVILLRNQNVHLGLCNGSRLRVLEMGDDTLRCAPVTPGPFTPKEVILHRMDLSPARAPTKEYSFIRHQFPIRLCYSMTINKSQGQTMDKVGIILRTPCFSHGQFYVAMSRVRTRNDIRVHNYRKTSTGSMSQYITNRVLSNILS